MFRYLDTLNCYRVENPLDDTGQDPYELSIIDFYLKATQELLSGKPLAEFGSAIPDPVTYPIQDAMKVNDTIIGEIVFTDNFGNCVTNITDSLFQDLELGILLKVNAEYQSFLRRTVQIIRPYPADKMSSLLTGLTGLNLPFASVTFHNGMP